jgi:hypothetical protein
MKPTLEKRLNAVEGTLRPRASRAKGPKGLQELYEDIRKNSRIVRVPHADGMIEVLEINLEIGDEIELDEAP